VQALGFAIIAAACIVKMPQIWKIAASNSAKGLNTLSFELEQLALTVFAIYGFVLGLPFSAYGEGIVMMLQNTVILAQVYVLSRAPAWRPLLVLSLFGAAMACVATGQYSWVSIFVLLWS
jgi:mannose-P-dolichol utilization defect protein 1